MEEKHLEQPTATSSQCLCNNLEEVGENEQAVGSILGKFKSVEDLTQAYLSLQAEFTKKSQKLSELLKRDNSNSSNIMQSQSNVEIKPEKENEEPLFEQPAWQTMVADFLKQNPLAKHFAPQIANEILSDKVLASQPYSLEIAFGRVLAKHFKLDSERIEDEEFLQNYVLNNDKIKNLVIKNVLNSVQKHKTPTTIGSSGGYLGLSPQEKPKTLQEANRLFERMLKNK